MGYGKGGRVTVTRPVTRFASTVGPSSGAPRHLLPDGRRKAASPSRRGACARGSTRDDLDKNVLGFATVTRNQVRSRIGDVLAEVLEGFTFDVKPLGDQKFTSARYGNMRRRSNQSPSVTATTSLTPMLHRLQLARIGSSRR